MMWQPATAAQDTLITRVRRRAALGDISPELWRRRTLVRLEDKHVREQQRSWTV
jgi:hypothetical protein